MYVCMYVYICIVKVNTSEYNGHSSIGVARQGKNRSLRVVFVDVVSFTRAVGCVQRCEWSTANMHTYAKIYIYEYARMCTRE